MTYDVILFTDLSSRFWHAKSVGAYRIASELRNAGYSVKVIDFAGEWFTSVPALMKLLTKIIGQNTLFVGFSSTFFGFSETVDEGLVDNKIRSSMDRTPQPYPCKKTHFDLWCKYFKKLWPSVKLVYGGAKANTRLELNDSFDYMVLGIADRTVVDLASHLKFNTPLKFNLIGKKWKIIDYDVTGSTFNFPCSTTTYTESDHIFPGEVLAIETSRGCMFKCSFCNYPLLGRGKHNPAYTKQANILADEFKRNWDQHKITKYFIVDDTFNETTEKIQTVIDATNIAGVKIEAFAYIRIDILEKFPEQIKLLKDLGIKSVFFGIETLNDASAKSIGKGLASSRVKAMLDKCRNEWGDDVAMHTNYIVGLPHDTPSSLAEWTQWVLKDNPADASIFYPLQLSLNAESNKAKIFQSDFSLNADKYGYKEHNAQWQNDVWNFSAASKLANELNQTMFDSGKMKLAGMDIMGLMNFGYTFSELKNLAYKDLDTQVLNSKYVELFNQYKQKIFEFEGVSI